MELSGSHWIAEIDESLGKPEDLNHLVDDLDDLLQKGRCLKSHDQSKVAMVQWHGHALVIKRYNHRSWLHSLRHTLKGTRARRCAQQARRLADIGLQTPTVLGIVECKRRGIIWQSYLITAWVEAPLLNVCWERPEQSPLKLEPLLDELAHMLRTLEIHRITHGDLKHTNLCIAAAGPVLTDLDAMSRHRWNLIFQVYRKKDLRRFLMDLPKVHHRGLLNRLKSR